MPLLVVGTFNTAELFTLEFDPTDESLRLLSVSPARGNHSWLSTATLPIQDANTSKLPPTHLYATCWTDPPSVAAYQISRPTEIGEIKRIGATFELVNTAETAARSGYVLVGFPAHASNPVLYTVGGPTGEVIGIDAETGGFDLPGVKHPHIIRGRPSGDLIAGIGPAGRVQELDFVTGRCSLPAQTLIKMRREEAQHAAESTSALTTSLDASNGKNTMDFGGLRHGSHGIDLSPDGMLCFVPDIGRNCIWVYDVNPDNGSLTLAEKSVAPRKNDGPRHTISHPGGKYIYSLQEHSSMIDVFEIHRGDPGTRLEWKQGVKIIPTSHDEALYWADEVRLSCSTTTADGCYPRYLFSSTRGLTHGTKGWIGVFELDHEGLILASSVRDEALGNALCLWQTPTSGGWANAIEPAPYLIDSLSTQGTKIQYAALTDSEVGVVRMLRLTTPAGQCASIEEVSTLHLGKDPHGKLREAATALWI